MQFPVGQHGMIQSSGRLEGEWWIRKTESDENLDIGCHIWGAVLGGRSVGVRPVELAGSTIG